MRRFLEPGPIVLVSSAWRGRQSIMTMGWHMVMEFEPSLLCCYIWDANFSYDLVRRSRECVVNVPTIELASTVVRIGNCSGRDLDKFRAFGLTAVPGDVVKAPMVGECYANFECRVADPGLIKRYGLFILEVVRAHVARSPKFPETIHYRGDGLFMVSGPTTSRWRRLFRPEML